MIDINPVTAAICTSVKVERDWGAIIAPLFDHLNLDYHGFGKNGEIGFENDIFSIYPSGDDVECDCSNPNKESETDEKHDDNCSLYRANFHFKPTNFKIWWHKYPMRGATMLPEISTVDFMRMIIQCVDRVDMK